MDHSDSYSENLARDVYRHVVDADGEVVGVFSHPEEDPDADVPEGWARHPEVARDSDRLAAGVCAVLRDAPDAVVFYTGRSPAFVGMLNGIELAPACGDRPVTVVGGDALTRLVLDPAVSLGDYGFLRLYYAAFGSRQVPPESDSRQNLLDMYEPTYGDGDIAVDISDPALNYDAFTLMHRAMHRAASPDEPATRSGVADALASGRVEFEGATGYITVSDLERVPPAKPVLVVPATVDPSDGATQPLLACGVISEDLALTRWGPGDRYACPSDPAGSS
jgi:hypothetical protein